MRIAAFLWVILWGLLPFGGAAQNTQGAVFEWEQLASLPDTNGFAGPFAGVSNGALIVAGGANFPAGMPWEGGPKVWHDDIYVLPAPDKTWQLAGKLPARVGYGVSITIPEGLLCIGGSNAESHVQDVYLLKWDGQRVSVLDAPDLPISLANASGAWMDGKIYIAGGTQTPDADTPSDAFLMLDWEGGAQKWEALESWPGPARMLAVSGVVGDAFYVMSGVNLVPNHEGHPTRVYLNDAYRYREDQGWERIADLPHAVAAAPSPAITSGQNHLLVVGGDDGQHFFNQASLREEHPGFSRNILGYHAITNSWTVLGEVSDQALGFSSWPPVTTTAVAWHGHTIIPSGEVKPGMRTTQVLQLAASPQKSGFAWVDIAILVAYFILVLGIGFYYSNGEKTQRDYFLGGSRIPWWAAGISIFATQLSAITFMSIPAKAFATDWVYFLTNMTIVAVAPIVIAIYLPFFRKLNIITAYEYLEKRFGVAARWTAGVAFILFQLGRMGIVIYLPSLALNAVMDINIYLCIVLIGGLSTAYTFMGGIEADIWNDMFQAILLIGGAIVSLVLIAISIDGGVGQIVSMGMEEGKLRLANMTWDITTDALWVVLIGSFFSNMVSYTSDQAVIQRYLTTKDAKRSAKSIWTNALLAIPATFLFFAVGTALWAFYKTHPELLSPLSKSDDIFPWFIAQQLPVGVSGLVITAIFAAAMSTVDSSLNSISAVVTNDFYKRLSPGATDQQCMAIAHRTTLTVGIVGIGAAVYIAYLNSPSMWDQYLKIVGLFGGALAGMFLVGVFVRRVHLKAVLVGFFGAATVLFLVQQYTSVHLLLYAAVGVLTCVLLSVLASYILPGKPGDEDLVYHPNRKN